MNIDSEDDISNAYDQMDPDDMATNSKPRDYNPNLASQHNETLNDINHDSSEDGYDEDSKTSVSEEYNEEYPANDPEPADNTSNEQETDVGNDPKVTMTWFGRIS
jgi:hypothetical protein